MTALQERAGRYLIDETTAITRFSPHLNREALSIFETRHPTPYHFNLHVDDVGQAVVLGTTGSGKSFLLNFLVTHAQKYEPATVIFDLGHSYRKLATLLGAASSSSDSANATSPLTRSPFPRLRRSAREIVLVNRDYARAGRRRRPALWSGARAARVSPRREYDELRGAAIVIITAGANEKAGGATDRGDPAGRLRLLATNPTVYKDIVPRIVAAAPHALLLVVTDPPDPLADVARRTSGMTEC